MKVLLGMNVTKGLPIIQNDGIDSIEASEAVNIENKCHMISTAIEQDVPDQGLAEQYHLEKNIESVFSITIENWTIKIGKHLNKAQVKTMEVIVGSGTGELRLDRITP